MKGRLTAYERDQLYTVRHGTNPHSGVVTELKQDIGTGIIDSTYNHVTKGVITWAWERPDNTAHRFGMNTKEAHAHIKLMSQHKSGINSMVAMSSRGTVRLGVSKSTAHRYLKANFRYTGKATKRDGTGDRWYSNSQKFLKHQLKLMGI